jgi:uncharacterized membrane protein
MDRHAEDPAEFTERKKDVIMRKLTHLVSLLLLLLSSIMLYAQDGKTGIGNTMRSNGRIYVVIVVILVILAGLILYLVRLDRKIRKFEKEN